MSERLSLPLALWLLFLSGWLVRTLLRSLKGETSKARTRR